VHEDTDTAFYGDIEDLHVGGTGQVAVDMTGSGILVLAGDNAYSVGAPAPTGTTVSSGTLVVITAAAQADTNLTVAAGATFIYDPSYTPPPQLANRLPTGPTAGGGLGDSSGTPGEAGDTPTPLFDVAPVVTAVQRACAGWHDQVVAVPSLVDATSATFLLSFNKSVTGVTPGDLGVVGDAAAGAEVTSVSGSGCDYWVTVSGIGASGNLGIDVLPGNSIADDAGTPLAMTALSSVQQYTIDRVLYWAPAAGPAPQDSYTWDAGENWRVGSLSGPQTGWCDNSSVVLSGAPQTIVVENPISVTSISVLSSGLVIDGNTITLVATPPAPLPEGEGSIVDVAVGTFTIDAGLVGDALVKDGNGELALGGTDSYSCTTTVNGGELQFQNGSTLPAMTALVVNAGIVDLGGGTTDLTTVTLCGGGSITDGALQADTSITLYSGSVLADLSGAAGVQKLGDGTAVLAGHDTYQGGTNAVAGTLVVVYADGLPGAATGSGTVVIQPTLYWLGNGDWTTGQWQFADGTSAPWIDGASVVIAAGSDLSLSGSVDVSSITVSGDATVGAIGAGTISFPSWGGAIDVQAGTATIHAGLAGNFAETGSGTLLVDGTLASAGITVAGGTLDAMSALAAPPLLAGGQALGPGAVFSGNESLAALDPAMFGLVQGLFVDQSIDRTDMIEILESAVLGGAVTPAALAALQMLTTPQNEALLAMPDYVGVLASDVVNGNPANANYQGQPLGNLTDQQSPQAMGATLQILVDKWFYGTDLPAIDPVFVSLSASYSAVAGPLYGDNADPELQITSSSDDEQGNLGDCYFIAALGAIADSNPGANENMIISNGVENGIASYTVRFYYQNNGTGPYIADYVTVNGLLPAWQNGGLVYDRPGPDGSYWMPIIEKAYAQWNETGHEGRDQTNTYAALYSGWMTTVDEQVLGTVATTYSPLASDLATKQAVIAALQNHEALTAGIFLSGDPTLFFQSGLVSDHAYEIASYDSDPNSPTYDTFLLENPWGWHEPLPLTWSQLCQYGWIAVADTSSTVPSDSTAAGATAAAKATVEATAATDVETRAAVLASVSIRQWVADRAFVVDVAQNGNLHPVDPTTDAYARALALILAESGR
jgi:autotransporter-associated beta strand protein